MLTIAGWLQAASTRTVTEAGIRGQLAAPVSCAFRSPELGPWCQRALADLMSENHERDMSAGSPAVWNGALWVLHTTVG